MMEDSYLMRKGQEQIYGTQSKAYGSSPAFIWPIKDPEEVNERRKEAGFTQTIEEYSKELIGDDFIYSIIKLEDVSKLKKLSLPYNYNP